MTMYKHFPSKSDLIIEVLEQREASVADALTTFVNSKDTPLERVEAVFDWHDQWIKSDTFAGCMFINAAGEHFGRDCRVVDVSAGQKRRFVEFFAHLVIPIVGKRRAPTIARRLMILLDGAIVAAHVYGNLDAASEAREMAVGLLRSVPAQTDSAVDAQ